MDKPLILSVDDEPHITNLIKLSLDKKEYYVQGVFSGKEALFALKEKKFDLMIVDILMPEMDGYELIKKVRKNDEDIKILVLSVKAQINNKLKAIEVGVDDYITKPFDPLNLKRRVDKLL